MQRSTDRILINERDVSAANRTLKRFGIAGGARCGDAVELLFPPNHFDSVISADFLEHITDDLKVKVLREILHVVKPGGTAVFKTPNLSYLRLSLLYKQARALGHLENPLKIVIPHSPGSDDPQHIGLTTRCRFSRTLTDAGFLNFQFFYAPLRRLGVSSFTEVMSTEIPILRDPLSEDLF